MLNCSQLLLGAVACVLGACSGTVITSADSSGGAGGTGGGGAPSIGMTAGSAGMGGGPTAFALTSSAFTDMGGLSAEYDCGGASPPLSWTTGPRGTRSYAVVMVGPDSSSLGSSYHWVIWDIQAGTTSLPAAVAQAANPPVPPGSKQISPGIDWATLPGYSGPCSELQLTYAFSVFALNVAELPGVTPASTGADVFAAIQKSAIASATLTVTAYYYKS